MQTTEHKHRKQAVVVFIIMCAACALSAMGFNSIFTQDEKAFGVLIFAFWAVVTLVLARTFRILWEKQS